MDIPEKYKEGILYVLIGFAFFLVTIDLIFPIFMFIMKLIFYSLGCLSVIGGLIQIRDNFKNKNTHES